MLDLVQVSSKVKTKVHSLFKIIFWLLIFVIITTQVSTGISKKLDLTIYSQLILPAHTFTYNYMTKSNNKIINYFC